MHHLHRWINVEENIRVCALPVKFEENLPRVKIVVRYAHKELQTRIINSSKK